MNSMLSQDQSIPPIATVVLAGSANLHFWPLSRIHAPLQFEKTGSGKPSPFQQTLLAVDALGGAEQPLVFVGAQQYKKAQAQIVELSLIRRPRITVEPTDRGTWSCALAGAFMAARTGRETPLLFLDALFPPQNHASFRNTIGQLALAQPNDCLVALGQPGMGKAASHLPSVTKEGHANPLSLIRVTPNDAAIEETGMGVQCHYLIGHALFTSPRRLIEFARLSNSEQFDRINAATTAGQELGGATWMDINLWSALPQSELANTLINATDHILVRPIDMPGPVVTVTGNRAVFHHENSNCLIMCADSTASIPAITLEGCSDIEVLASPDALAIRKRGWTGKPAPTIDMMRRAEQVQLFHAVGKSHDWGREEIIEHQPRCIVSRLTIDPGSNIEPHFHTHRSEHWHVLSGSGAARLGQQDIELEAGSSLDIPRLTLHGGQNSGDQPLVIIETKHGGFLSDDDCTFARTHAPNKFSTTRPVAAASEAFKA